MKHWLMSVAALFLGVAVTVGGVPLGLGAPDPAQASEPTPALLHAATNGSIVVGADSAGKLWWSEGDGEDGTWVDSGTALAKNGVTSLIWTGDKFIATSFFAFARSTNGKDWTVRVFPLGESFDPGNIISDAEFFSRDSMSLEEIDAFIDGKVDDCRDGYTCLEDFREDTFDRDKTVLCEAYDGADNESAAEIIYKVANACGVAAEVLIVLLQKEMGLVTHTWPSGWRYDKATGYACPDTAPCDTRYYGFYNQVYNAAKQFKRYANPPGTSRFFTWYPVGKQSNVRWHPRSSCGTTPVTIQNQATAGLYYYTPYAPNQAAMTNLTGLGDGCSSYGNRNFWRLYNYWFNETKEFGTYLTSFDGALYAVDGDGVLARSNDGVSWLRVAQVPNVGGTNRVADFGLTEDGQLAVLTSKGQAFQTTDLAQWASLEVIQSTEPQTFVANHTVQSGDTVWAIASANGVSVQAVVDENDLPGDGSFIQIGDQLTITKTGEVPKFVSPIEPHSSSVSLASLGIEESAPVNQDTESDSTDEQSDSTTEAPSESTTEESTGTSVAQPLIVQQGQGNEVYVVKRGDTLLRIAFRNQTSVSKLAEWNSIRNVNRIYIGQRLIVGQADQEQKFHRVEPGDTVASIAELRDVSVAQVLALNGTIHSNSRLKVGGLVRVQ